MQEAEATNGADRRVCILVIQADGGGVLLGRDAQKAWSLPCTQIGGDEGGPEAAGRRLAQELGLPSSAKELQCQVMPTAVSQPRTDHDQTIDEQTGMVFSTRPDRDLPELVVFSLQAPGLSALRSGTTPICSPSWPTSRTFPVAEVMRWFVRGPLGAQPPRPRPRPRPRPPRNGAFPR